MDRLKKIFRSLLKIFKWFFLIILGLAVISALYNLTLPIESDQTEILGTHEKLYIAENFHLQEKMGDSVWPGWSESHIPVIVYNESYAFLVGYPDPNPPAGWYKMPAKDLKGSEWEQVKTDDFFGETYYRQYLPDPDITPENFTVKVGDQWVATMQTKEYAEIFFYKNFRRELPPVIENIFPYAVFWNLLMGTAENYICGLAHESFHAFQGERIPTRFAEAEMSTRLSSAYPWDQPVNANLWPEEIELLLQAHNSENSETAKQFIARFIEKRNERRKKAGLSAEMVHYEQEREWLEGLAKYVELKIGLKAQTNASYEPINGISKAPEFKDYKTRQKYFDQQVDEVSRTATRSGESRFYYGGMLQAMVLDRLMPKWKEDAFTSTASLEGLLFESLKRS